MSGINSIPPERFIFSNNRQSFVTCSNVFGDNQVLDRLANGVDDGPNSDRIVPTYKSDGTLGNIPSENKQRINKIIEKLTEYVRNNFIKYDLTTDFRSNHTNRTYVLRSSPSEIVLSPIDFQIPLVSSALIGVCVLLA